MSAVDVAQQKLEDAKKALKKQAADAADLEREVQRLQEAEQLKANAALSAEVADYGKISKDLTLRATNLQGTLQGLTDKIKASPGITEPRLKQVEDKRAKVDADIKVKSDLVEKLKLEVLQIGKDVANAETDVTKREKDLSDKRASVKSINQDVADLQSQLDKSVTDFKKDDPPTVFNTWYRVLEYRNKFDKDLKPFLVSPDDLQKDLDGKQKALDEAKEKRRILKVQQIEKQAELEAATKAQTDAQNGRDKTIVDFIDNMTAG